MSLCIDFDKASWTQSADGFALQLYVKNKQAVLQFLQRMQEKRTYTAELKEYRKRRSLDANAYLWVLCEKLALERSKDDLENPVTKGEVYREHIAEYGIWRDEWQPEEAAKTFCAAWEMLGDGWVTKRVDFKNGLVQTRYYYGSSRYNTKQMSRLIDGLVQDCKALNIETMTPDEQARLLARWEDCGNG